MSFDFLHYVVPYKKIPGLAYDISECGSVRRHKRRYVDKNGLVVTMPIKRLKVKERRPRRLNQVTLRTKDGRKTFTIAKLLTMTYGVGTAVRYLAKAPQQRR